jgi:hypothetical protein
MSAEARTEQYAESRIVKLEFKDSSLHNCWAAKISECDHDHKPTFIEGGGRRGTLSAQALQSMPQDAL